MYILLALSSEPHQSFPASREASCQGVFIPLILMAYQRGFGAGMQCHTDTRAH